VHIVFPSFVCSHQEENTWILLCYFLWGLQKGRPYGRRSLTHLHDGREDSVRWSQYLFLVMQMFLCILHIDSPHVTA